MPQMNGIAATAYIKSNRPETITNWYLDLWLTCKPANRDVVLCAQKVDIATHIHQQTGIPTQEAVQLLDWILELFKTTLQAGEPIVITGFGKFAVRNKRARQGRNPRTGEAMTISARRVATFHASPLLKTQMNDRLAEEREDVA